MKFCLYGFVLYRVPNRSNYKNANSMAHAITITRPRTYGLLRNQHASKSLAHSNTESKLISMCVIIEGSVARHKQLNWMHHSSFRIQTTCECNATLSDPKQITKVLSITVNCHCVGVSGFVNMHCMVCCYDIWRHISFNIATRWPNKNSFRVLCSISSAIELTSSSLNFNHWQRVDNAHC